MRFRMNFSSFEKFTVASKCPIHVDVDTIYRFIISLYIVETVKSGTHIAFLVTRCAAKRQRCEIMILITISIQTTRVRREFDILNYPWFLPGNAVRGRCPSRRCRRGKSLDQKPHIFSSTDSRQTVLALLIRARLEFASSHDAF